MNHKRTAPLALATAKLRARLDEQRADELRATPGAEGLDIELRRFGVEARGGALAVKLGVRVRDPSGLLDGIRTEHLGVAENEPEALMAAVDAWVAMVLPVLRRRCASTRDHDLQIAQAVAPHPERPAVRANAKQRWSVWVGPPQLRAPLELLEGLAARVEAESLFDRLAKAGTLPHFPHDEPCHWLELTVARHGARRLSSCRIDGASWTAARSALAEFEFPEGDVPMHVHAFVLLCAPDQAETAS